jgi:hypothetical protein
MTAGLHTRQYMIVMMGFFALYAGIVKKLLLLPRTEPLLDLLDVQIQQS